MATKIPAAIAINEALSGAVPLTGKVITGIVMPAAWTAAVMTFQVSVDDGVTWSNLYDSAGTEVSFTVSASRFVAVDPTLWIGINHIKVRSGTSGAAVNQAAARSVILIGQ